MESDSRDRTPDPGVSDDTVDAAGGSPTSELEPTPGMLDVVTMPQGLLDQHYAEPHRDQPE
jgi:hypothetical protein